MTKVKNMPVIEVGYFYCSYDGDHLCSMHDTEFYYDQDDTKLNTVMDHVYDFFPSEYMCVENNIVTRNPNEISIYSEDKIWNELIPWLESNYCYDDSYYKFLALVRLVYGKSSDVFIDLLYELEHDHYSIKYEHCLEDMREELSEEEICEEERSNSNE